VPRIFWDLDTNQLTPGASEPLVPTSGTEILEGFAARYGGVLPLDVCFTRAATNDEAVDVGISPGLGVLVKKQSGTNRFDDPSLLPSPSFTRTAEILTPKGSFTGSGTTNILTFTTAHGLKDGAPVQVSTTAADLPAGISADTIYYARDCTALGMRLAATRGGSAIALVDAGTGTHSLAAASSFVYRAELSLAEPILAKLLGVDNANVKEQVAVQCIADVAAALNGKYFDIYTGASAYLRVWIDVGNTGTPPAAGSGGTLVEIDISSGATAAAIATAISVHASITAAFTVSVVTDTVTLTSLTIGARGNHHPQSSGFTLTLLAAGATAYGVTDETSTALELELYHTAYGDLEISEHLGLTVKNSFYRTGAGSPSASGGNVRQGVADIGNGVSTLAVVFPVPFPSASYKFRDLQIVNTTDGSPVILFIGTITARSATGFTVHFNGNTDSANYDLEYTCEL